MNVSKSLFVHVDWRTVAMVIDDDYLVLLKVSLEFIDKRVLDGLFLGFLGTSCLYPIVGIKEENV
jgi:hypothetical protein